VFGEDATAEISKRWGKGDSITQRATGSLLSAMSVMPDQLTGSSKAVCAWVQSRRLRWAEIGRGRHMPSVRVARVELGASSHVDVPHPCDAAGVVLISPVEGDGAAASSSAGAGDPGQGELDAVERSVGRAGALTTEGSDSEEGYSDDERCRVGDGGGGGGPGGPSVGEKRRRLPTAPGDSQEDVDDDHGFSRRRRGKGGHG